MEAHTTPTVYNGVLHFRGTHPEAEKDLWILEKYAPQPFVNKANYVDYI